MFLIKKQDQEQEMKNVNEVLAQELHKPVIKNSGEVKYMRGLKIVFGMLI